MRIRCLVAFVALSILVGWQGIVVAAPFLVSDPNPASEEITVFKLSFDGGAAIDSVPVSNAVRHDLAGITSGSHTVTAQACNLWGCSAASSPFVFNKIIPSAVGGMRIVP